MEYYGERTRKELSVRSQSKKESQHMQEKEATWPELF